MNSNILKALLSVLLVCIGSGHAFAWGRGGGGGGYRGGGFSASGSRSFEASGPRGNEFSGSRSGEVSGYGGYRGGEISGSRSGEVTGPRGNEYSGSRSGEVSGFGGYRGGEVSGYRGGEVSGFRGGAVGGHAAVATDFGFGHVAGVEGSRGFVAAGHYTTPYAGGALVASGAAVRGGFYHYGAGVFNAGWWGAHPGAWRPVGWGAGYGWGWADAAALGLWFGWTAPPVYYDYGNTIVYQGDQVYIGSQPGPTAAVYYQQADDLALSAPAPLPTEKKDDWQPLGTFALVQGQQSDASAVFQLAVNKAGVIGGNYYNVLTDTTLQVRGAVDPKTQRASWIVGDQKTTVYDTGIYNLTKDQSPLLIHFGKDRTQQWLLVRIPEKDAQAPPPSKDAPIPAPPSTEGTARVTIVVPADAAIFFDGVATSLTGTERTFTTPELATGGTYEYSIRARWTQNGMPVEQTRKVLVKAGAQVRVDFTSPLP